MNKRKQLFFKHTITRRCEITEFEVKAKQCREGSALLQQITEGDGSDQNGTVITIFVSQ